MRTPVWLSLKRRGLRLTTALSTPKAAWGHHQPTVPLVPVEPLLGTPLATCCQAHTAHTTKHTQHTPLTR
jgi:hypothetical protein